MIEIIPNLHPMVVHFPIALIMIATVLYISGVLLKVSFYKELLISSKWCLWLAGLSAIAAAFFGWQAYNTVAHDAISHAAMTVHRNWALPTTGFILLVALFGLKIQKHWGVRHKLLTTILLVAATALTGITGYLGAEAVYRYGIGVMRIPKTDGHKHEGSSAGEDHHMPSAHPMMKKHQGHHPHHGHHGSHPH